jgi:hypothetical protein
MSQPSPDEFLPLPYFPWLSRPETLPLDVEEAATAIYLAHGDIGAAAGLLKVTLAKLSRFVRRCPRLQRLRDDLASSASPSAKPRSRSSPDHCRLAA